MTSLIIGVLLAQATASLTISVQVVRPTCVALDASGEARVVAKRALGPGDRPLGCTTDPAANAPRIVQHIELPAAAGRPEERLVEVIY